MVVFVTRLMFLYAIIFIGGVSSNQVEHENVNTGQFDRLYVSGIVNGDIRYISESQEYHFESIIASGGESGYQFLWKAIQGDFILRAEVEHSAEAGEGAEFGWMVKNSLTESSDYFKASVRSGGMVEMSSSTAEGRKSVTGQITSVQKYMVQVRRINNLYIFKAAPKGEHLQTIGTLESDLNNQIFAGLFVQSGSDQQKIETQFRNVRIVKPFLDNNTQYQQYLGSRLETLDIESGNREVLYENEHSFQAPNWTVDGEELIYNSNGYLFSYRLDDGDISVLNTGFATNNNNDHVITFDGTQIAISHHVPEDNNNSTIFMLPIEGSDEPKQVTKSGVGASYLHGISPDNQTVLFTGYRNGKYDIYAADVNTMEETQLTDTPGLDDGSEYSPDGEFIYFNSNRTGTMQIWRMRADGSDKTQLTYDENTHDWFPHISPDGKWIVFMSYGLDVESGDHPFYKEVTLQLMSAEGGEPEVVAYLYGGQGTINVPSWSPDSKRIAFVSNSGRFY